MLSHINNGGYGMHHSHPPTSQHSPVAPTTAPERPPHGDGKAFAVLVKVMSAAAGAAKEAKVSVAHEGETVGELKGRLVLALGEGQGEGGGMRLVQGGRVSDLACYVCLCNALRTEDCCADQGWCLPRMVVLSAFMQVLADGVLVSSLVHDKGVISVHAVMIKGSGTPSVGGQ